MKMTTQNIIMPTVALRGLVVFPDMNIHFDVGREKSVLAIKAAMADNQEIFLITQQDIRDDDPKQADLYKIGTIAKVVQTLRIPNSDTLRVSVKGIRRAKVCDIIQSQPYLISDITPKSDVRIKKDDEYSVALVRKTKDLFEIYAQLSPQLSTDVILNVLETKSAGEIADFIAGNIMLEYDSRMKILSELNPVRRLEKMSVILANEAELLKIENYIEEQVQTSIDKNQREYYLHEQMKAISEELNEGEAPEEEYEKYKKSIKALGLKKEYEEKLLKECARLSKMQPQSPEANVSKGYLDTCLELPWNKFSRDNLELDHAKKVLNRDHYGLDKIKDRIIEMLAVRNMSNKNDAQILCFVGPPGVGKTSIAKSIAQAMGKKFARISLGGIRDEAEIRGHRKTYIGSMPGRIISAIRQAKTSNPVILLDEIDKVGADYKGDPSAALLEALDPEQNCTFCDHYIEIPFDLSNVLFITTANDKSTIPAPLLDRMEIIDISSYTLEEKFHIAKEHLIPKQRKRHGLTAKTFKISDEAVYALIDGYTREAGVRKLEQKISTLCRKADVGIVNGEFKSLSVKGSDLEALLGAKPFIPDMAEEEPCIGVVNGLAWTSVGGEMLQVEAAVLDGTGKVELTGSLGDVMKESAQAAISYVRSRVDNYNIDSSFYKTKDIHIHVPEGAVPKDGPSAGVTMATALVSALTMTPVNQKIAMTGEITLRGRVLPIGGLKEKSMAAYKYGINTVLIPEKNLPDLSEVDSAVKEKIDFIPIKTLDEVFEAALVKKQAPHKAKAANTTAYKENIYTTIQAGEKNEF